MTPKMAEIKPELNRGDGAREVPANGERTDRGLRTLK